MEKKYCKNCFATLEDDAKFCTACGAPVVDEPKVETPVEEAPRYTDAHIERILAQKEAEFQAQQMQSQINSYYGDNEPDPDVSKKNSIFSMVFGIISAEFAFSALLSGFAALIMMIVALVFGSMAKKKANLYIAEAGAPNGMCKVGKIISSISIPVSIVFGILGTLIGILML